MNVEFSNAYQEVLLENLDVILKQNFMMQTRLKLLEKEANVRAEMQAKIDDLTVNNQKLIEQLESTQNTRCSTCNSYIFSDNPTFVFCASCADEMEDLAMLEEE